MQKSFCLALLFCHCQTFDASLNKNFSKLKFINSFKTKIMELRDTPIYFLPIHHDSTKFKKFYYFRDF